MVLLDRLVLLVLLAQLALLLQLDPLNLYLPPFQAFLDYPLPQLDRLTRLNLWGRLVPLNLLVPLVQLDPLVLWILWVR